MSRPARAAAPPRPRTRAPARRRRAGSPAGRRSHRPCRSSCRRSARSRGASRRRPAPAGAAAVERRTEPGQALAGGAGRRRAAGGAGRLRPDGVARPTRRHRRHADRAGPGREAHDRRPRPAPTAVPRDQRPPADHRPAAPAPPAATAAQAAAQPGLPLDEARAAIGAGDFPRAIGLLTEAKQRDPATPGRGRPAVPGPGRPGAGAPPARPGRQRRRLRRGAQAAARTTPTRRAASTACWSRRPTGCSTTDAGQARTALMRATEIDPARPEARERLARFAISPASAERVREIARWGKGTIDRLAYSPRRQAAGRRLLVRRLPVRRRAAAPRSASWRPARSSADAAFSPDGQEIAAAAGDGTVRIWKVADGAPVRSLDGHEARS